MSIVLSKIYERERPLIYFYLWNESDRIGCKKFTNQTIEHNLFITQPKERKGSVWYSAQELENLESDAEAKVKADPSIVRQMVEHSRREWEKILPYAKGEVRIVDGEEFLRIYASLVSFWYAMTTVYFRLPERPTISLDFTSAIYALRDETQAYSGPMAEYFATEFERLFPEFARFSHCVSPEDVREIIAGHGEALRAMLEDRFENGCALLDGVVYPLSKLSSELQKENLTLESIEVGTANEVTGSIGYKGIVRGVARVIKSKSDLDSVKDGEVLIARLTEPSYIIAMQKVLAFVTDEGGIMSHAAIVARELKKPCVIGTKFATQIFKDGDMVEVDADNGIVRIVQ